MGEFIQNYRAATKIKVIIIVVCISNEYGELVSQQCIIKKINAVCLNKYFTAGEVVFS